MEYELIVGGYEGVEDFSKRVSEKLTDGWKLYGPTIVTQSPTPNDDGYPQTDMTYAQAVVKAEDGEFIGVMPETGYAR